MFNTSGFASNGVSIFFDVSPDGQRFLFLREPTMPTTELVQITNWGAEVQAKLGGRDGVPPGDGRPPSPSTLIDLRIRRARYDSILRRIPAAAYLTDSSS